MNIPFVDLKKQYETIAEDIEQEVLGVLRSCGYISGAKVASLEKAFAEAHECKHCVAVNSGTAALHLALWSLDIGVGDEVILPVNTYIATAEAVSLTGATPVFADHDNYFNMDVAMIEPLVTNKTKAMIPVHLYGQPANMDAIVSLCESKNIDIIEDCAQAHLASLNGKPVGSFGKAGCFSFYPGKNLGACGEGGAVITNDKDLFEKTVQLHQHGVLSDKYHHLAPGHNYRMSEIQGAVLNVKIKHIADWTEKRRANADLYRKHLADVNNIQVPVEMDKARHVYHLFVIRADNRDKLSSYLNEQGIATGLHYPTPLHLQPAYANLGYNKGDFPVAEETCSRILSLPMFSELTEEQVEYTGNQIKAFYNN